MLNVLLESKAQHTRRVGGTLTSALVHGAIITGAVILTVQPPHPIIHEPTEERIRPFVIERPVEPQTPERPAPHDPAPVLPQQPPMPRIDVVPNTIAPVDPNVAPIENLRTGPALPAGPAVGPTGPVGAPTEVMDVRLVDKPPRVLRSENPRFPEALRSRGQNGRIVVQFVVDTLGRAEMNEFTVVDATDAQLADAVRAVLPRFRFTAGEAGGHKVRTMVALPFDFTLVR